MESLVSRLTSIVVRERSALWRYGIGALILAAAFTVRVLLEPMSADRALLSPYYVAVVLTSLVAGPGPGILTALGGYVLTTYFFTAPAGGFVPTAAYAVVTLLLVFVGTLARNAMRDLENAHRTLARNSDAAREAAAVQASKLREEARIVQTLHETGLSLASELELEKIVQTLTDATTSLSGAEFGAFFYNLVGDDGETHTLYAISGVPRERFAKFPMPRNTQVFGPTFRGDGVVRLDDVTLDPRYGQNAPYHGMPEGHLPVRSYLAVPVKSRDGEVLGGLFYGHPAPGMFAERHQRLVVGLAAHAAAAMENAKLYGKLADAVRHEQDARTRLEVANRTKDDFLATISHELRTPLTPILSWVRMLQGKTLDPPTTKRALESIERSARSQAQLVEDLLDVSRIISGKVRLDVRRLDLRPVIETAIESLRPAADAKGLRLQIILGERASLVSADADRIQQVVWNLLSNAIKFTPKGGRVQVALRRSDSHVAIEVSDNGQGIAPRFLPYVFERFQQADASTTRVHGGLGLGLAIVRHMVELHGGSVRCQSDGEGQGSTFTIDLPLAPLQSEVAAEPRPVAAGTYAAGAKLNGLRVLIVDDDRDTLDTIDAVLAGCGAIVKSAASAREALSALATWPADILISDIGMPEEDGYDLLRQVRALTPVAGGRIPAIALTAYARVEDRMKVLAAGFQMHVPKPIEPAELVTIVASVATWSRDDSHA